MLNKAEFLAVLTQGLLHIVVRHPLEEPFRIGRGEWAPVSGRSNISGPEVPEMRPQPHLFRPVPG